MYIYRPMRKKSQNSIEADGEAMVGFYEAIILFIEMMCIGQHCFDLRIISVKTNATNDLQRSFGVLADRGVDRIAIVEILVYIGISPVCVIIGVDQHQTDTKSELKQKEC